MPRSAPTQGRGRAKTRKPEDAPRPMWRKIVHVVLLSLSILFVLALLATAYGGYLSPLKYGGRVGILPLCFPIVAALAIPVFALECFFCRIGALISGLGIVSCAGPLLDLCPLHVTDPKAPQDAETFTLVTYNAFQFTPRDGDTAGGNPQLAYILKGNADIVCLQEALSLTPTEKNCISATQLDSLHARYPNIIHSGGGQCVLSKFDIAPIHLNGNEESFTGGSIGAYRVTLPSGRLIGLFNVHLNSYYLTDDDKALYKDITHFHRESIGDIRSQLLVKLSASAVGRARQAQQLMRWLRLYGGPDAIVCGDFNDVSNCYTIHTLSDAGLRDVYPEVGFGSMYTYNANRFYFCIDHVMCRGDLKPLWLRKGHLRASDHYPLEVKFALVGSGYN